MGEGLTPPCPKIVRGQQKLTPEQKAYARAFARERIAAMLSTAPIDEQDVEAQVRQVYSAAGVKPPRTIRWFDSPRSFIQAYIPDYERLNAISRDDCSRQCRVFCRFPSMKILSAVWRRGIDDPAHDNGRIIVGSKKSVYGKLTVELAINMEKFKDTGAANDVLSSLREVGTWTRNWKTIVAASLWNSRNDSTTWCQKAFLMVSLAAYHNALALAPHRFFHEMLEDNPLIHLARFNEMASGYYLGDKEALVVRKPTLVEHDAQGLLHCDSGPCLQYRDGWSIYAWHGGRVPEKVILHPEHVTWEDLAGRQNAETRRAMRERFGFARFIELVGGKPIDAGGQSDPMGERLTPPCPKIVRGQQKLTPEQAAYARAFARERIAALLSTAPIDEQEAETYLRTAYLVAGEEPPAVIRWFDSPLSFLRACVPYFKQLFAQPSMQGDCSMHCEDHCRLTRDYPRPASRHVWGGLGNELQRDVQRCMQTRIRMGTVVADNLRHHPDTIMPICGQYVVRDSVAAFSNALALAPSRFFHEVFEENELIYMACFTEMVFGYRLEYLLDPREALVVRKPIFLQFDDQGRLHSNSGPCMQFRDGWSVYAWHGVRVPEKLILHPEYMTREEWMQESNVETRRAIQERLGPERFIELVGGKQIDAGRRGKLIEIELGRGDPERVAHYVHVQDSSTERQYYLRVPPSITSTDEAIAWTFGMNARDYQPGQET